MSQGPVEEKILNYFKSDPYFSEFLPDDFSAETSLRQLGVFDSLSLVNVVSFFENEFSISFEVTDINESNFESVKTLTQYVEGRMPGKS